MNGRRQFVLRLAPLTAAVAILPRLGHAQGLPALTETDPMALALGFKLNTADVNQAKYPKHSKDQSCANCLHFMQPGAATARCDLFNKVVPAGGWCGGYSKRT